MQTQKTTSFHKLFLSTLSLRRATSDVLIVTVALDDFYPRSPCGERLVTVGLLMYNLYFYPRSPCGERLMHALKFANFVLFLSTLSLRRATRTFKRNQLQNSDFYPRSPCGERHHYLIPRIGTLRFLSTLSLRRATVIREPTATGNDKFLSTLSLRRATESRQPSGRPTTYFYPRSPCGERHAKLNIRQIQKIISIHALLAESDRLLNSS